MRNFFGCFTLHGALTRAEPTQTLPLALVCVDAVAAQNIFWPHESECSEKFPNIAYTEVLCPPDHHCCQLCDLRCVVSMRAQAKRGFGARTFDGKSVDANYFPEERFAAKAFST